MSNKYPKLIFVQKQYARNDDEYLEAAADFDTLPEDGEVAIYELREMGKRKTEIKLER